MTASNGVLRQVVFAPGARVLQRPAKAEAGSASAPGTAAVDAPAHAAVGPTGTAGSTRASADAVDGPTEAPGLVQQPSTFDEGYRQGLAEGRLELEQRAKALALQLSRGKLQELQALAQQQVKEQSDAMLLVLSKQCGLLSDLVEQMPAALTRYLAEAESDMVALVHDTVCRILGEEVARPAGIAQHLRQAMASWSGTAPLSLHLHPDDLAALQSDEQVLQRLAARGFAARDGSLRWIADAEIRMGGCVLKSTEGALDARLETQMRNLQTSLLRVRASQSTPINQGAAERP